MQQKQSNDATNFHAVAFIRHVRAKRSAEYQNDRQQYLERARKAMEAFKQRMNMPAANVEVQSRL